MTTVAAVNGLSKSIVDTQTPFPRTQIEMRTTDPRVEAEMLRTSKGIIESELKDARTQLAAARAEIGALTS